MAYCYQVLVVTGGGLTSTEETPRRNLCCTEFQEEPFSFVTQQVGLQAAPFSGAQRRSPGAILDLTHFQGDDFFYPKMSICSSLFRNPGYATEIEPNINDHSSTLQSDSSPSEAAFSCLCVLYDFMTSPCQWQVCLRSVV